MKNMNIQECIEKLNFLKENGEDFEFLNFALYAWNTSSKQEQKQLLENFNEIYKEL